jgi:hypothetical protein
MAKKTVFKGESFSLTEPEWQPLLNLLAGRFMCMFGVRLEDGRTVYAYKHSWTRGYIHLADDGTAFVYVDRDRYREVEAEWLLEKVLENYDWRVAAELLDEYREREASGAEEVP